MIIPGQSQITQLLLSIHKSMWVRRLLLCGGCLLAGYALAEPSAPLDPKQIATLEEEEVRLWREGDTADKHFLRAGRLYQHPALTAYLQRIMDRIYPEWAGTIQVRLVNDPSLNAFALPNGSIYIYTGLLARLDNEAQLATVLAHEGAHFILRHGYLHRQQIKGASAFGLVVGVMGVPIVSILGQLAAVSSMFGYSQTLETEADDMGFRRLVLAGYDPKESVRVFEHLAEEAKTNDHKEPFFFASHPKLTERMESYQKLLPSAGAENGAVEAERFESSIGDLRALAIESDLGRARFKNVLVILEDAERRKRYPAHVDYFLGEAYRLRGEEGDLEKARAAYLKSIQAAPDFAPVYRQLGLLCFKQQQLGEAKDYFTRYLQKLPAAQDKAFIEDYLQHITLKEKP